MREIDFTVSKKEGDFDEVSSNYINEVKEILKMLDKKYTIL